MIFKYDDYSWNVSNDYSQIDDYTQMIKLKCIKKNMKISFINQNSDYIKRWCIENYLSKFVYIDYY